MGPISLSNVWRWTASDNHYYLKMLGAAVKDSTIWLFANSLFRELRETIGLASVARVVRLRLRELRATIKIQRCC
jgi:hypothetical protein